MASVRIVGGSAGDSPAVRRRKIALVRGDVLDADDPLVGLERDHAIDQQKRVAVGQNPLDRRVVERQSGDIRHEAKGQYTSRMKKTLAAMALILLAAPSAFAQKRPVTIDDILEMKAVGAPTVSPDGTQVLYTVRQWESEQDRMESRTRIWKVPVAGGPARQITFGERGDSQPQWSPDGRYISFVSARGAGTGDDAPRAQIYSCAPTAAKRGS